MFDKQKKRFIILVLLIFAFSGCSKTVQQNADGSKALFSADHWSNCTIPVKEERKEGTSAPEGMPSLDALPYDYSEEQAVSDGCVNYYDLPGGSERMVEFFENAAAGECDAVRVVRNYFSADNRSDVYDIEFDGDKYISYRYIRHRKPNNDRNKTYNETAFEEKVTYRVLNETDKGPDSGYIDQVLNRYGDNAELAMEDGCILLRFNSAYLSPLSFAELLEGEEQWKKFYYDTVVGTSSRVRIAIEISEQEDVETNGEYGLKVYEIDYDGKYFYAREFSQRTSFDGTKMYDLEVITRYSNLIVGKCEVRSGHPATVFALTMSEDYSWNAIEHNEKEIAKSSDSSMIRIPHQ
ncbi:MAG: hypothetical protein IKM51_03010, partial [Oscillospiraceae bacterium]|nr:hypothetical protein [Oscillospiraceae bacterium]